MAAASPAAADQGDEGTFTVAYLQDVDSFNPFLGIVAESFEMWSLMYDSLTGYTLADMQPDASLATDWTSSDDGLTWTYTMRDDATWSDGEPLTSADVAYTYGRILDGGPERSTWGSYLKGVTDVATPDDTTVELTFDKPSSSMPLLPSPSSPSTSGATSPRSR